MSVRWIWCSPEGPDAGLSTDEPGLAMAALPIDGQPAVILSFKEFRLYLVGEETLESLLGAITAAYDEVQRARAG